MSYTTLDYFQFFKHVDTNGNGVIEFDEFRNYMIDKTPFAQCRNPLETIEITFQLMDMDGNKTIDFSEFLRFMLVLPKKPFDGFEKYCFYFHLIDDNQSNSIDATEIKRLLKALKKDSDSESCKEIIDAFDWDQSGELSFDEFKRIFYK